MALVANEYVDSNLKSGTPGIICTVDTEKAYDHDKWDLLIYIMQQMGFRELWRKCIKLSLFSQYVCTGELTPVGFFPNFKRSASGCSSLPASFYFSHGGARSVDSESS